jgi:hypothetical protein
MFDQLFQIHSKIERNRIDSTNLLIQLTDLYWKKEELKWFGTGLGYKKKNAKTYK